MNEGNFRKFLAAWAETVEMVYLLTEETLRINHLIDKEIERLKNKSEEEILNELKPWFRIVIRSSITTIEAICYRLKQNAILICSQREKSLSLPELGKLKEKKRDRDGRLRNYYLETKENIIFTLRINYYAVDSPFEIKDHEGWTKLCETIEVRNRLTHPKKKDDLDVSPQQFNYASIGFQWFMSRIEELSELTRKHRDGKSQGP